MRVAVLCWVITAIILRVSVFCVVGKVVGGGRTTIEYTVSGISLETRVSDELTRQFPFPLISFLGKTSNGEVQFDPS